MEELQTLKTIAETLNEANDLQTMLRTVLKQLVNLTKLRHIERVVIFGGMDCMEICRSCKQIKHIRSIVKEGVPE